MLRYNNTMPANSNDERLAKLSAQKRQIEAQISRLNARQSAENRKRDTRRKILAGAVILRLASEQEAVKDLLNEALDKSLKLPRDRSLFDLPVEEAPVVATEKSVEKAPDE